MKQMVNRAVMTSPIRRDVTFAELERVQVILLMKAVNCASEEMSKVREKQGW